MSSIFDEMQNCATYRQTSICIMGNIDNWKEIAESNSLIAENSAEIVAWWVFHKRPLNIFKGDYLILYNESI